MSWLFSQALVEASSAADSSGGVACALSSATPTPRAYLWRGKTTGGWSRFPSGMTCEPLTDDRGEALLRWCLVGSRARTSAPPGRASGSTEHGAGSGVKWRGLSVRYDLATSGWRTAQCLFDEACPESSVILPRWGMMRGGGLWERITPGLRTSGTGSGCLPTPTKSDGEGGPGCSGRDGGENLRTTVSYWPTPNVPNGGRRVSKKATIKCGTTLYMPDGRKCQVVLEQAVAWWPTPNATDARMGTRNVPGQTQLCHHVMMFPTPISRDHRSPGDPATHQAKADRCAQPLSEVIGGQLNPDWVCWLMGWPIGWTSMDLLPESRFLAWLAAFRTVSDGCGASATGKCQQP